ncbi:hypothetical protein DFH06DRAFT_1128782 [Mycena polygramma]|nr:hypothetical protein DFH06DRAFT_1128782 [Mycena polygramma]
MYEFTRILRGFSEPPDQFDTKALRAPLVPLLRPGLEFIWSTVCALVIILVTYTSKTWVPTFFQVLAWPDPWQSVHEGDQQISALLPLPDCFRNIVPLHDIWGSTHGFLDQTSSSPQIVHPCNTGLQQAWARDTKRIISRGTTKKTLDPIFRGVMEGTP